MQHSASPLSRFLNRLLLRSALTHDEQQAILGLSGEAERFNAHADIVRPGECVDTACLIDCGLVARFDQMLDGLRQVTAFYISGDMCDLHSVVVPRASWSITAVSQVTVVRIPHRQLRDLCIRHPAIAVAFWRDGTVDASIFAKWAGNLGRKNAKARIAHVFCEMATRTEIAQLGSRTCFEFQVTQDQLADAVGMTPVHVNRMLQSIRAEGLLVFRTGHVEIPDWDALASVAEFDPAYLVLDQEPQRVMPAEAA